ncbi:hypothetical protein E2C01_097028 [Portunus trituberculatus]|uniref:Uncharacterized protein n=1 Tax=Portunus trituberculatus TaxID=210409 RepID=A0A5B7K3I6_PORTR|nr:hypothetical protein [Portunus trituberculatus]
MTEVKKITTLENFKNTNEKEKERNKERMASEQTSKREEVIPRFARPPLDSATCALIIIDVILASFDALTRGRHCINLAPLCGEHCANIH